ncbi:hypothetical protein JAAARDRAFT_42953 [Jaapia argillacea MUCL 33604]|uniref:HhH-GPD domain-containing protein n=1 Tax=Jaapia argillacea MUCL 33604 TaxID=933084 RepID=A0A067PFZ5_9AGAM|nr:hypothetical protein JAAARDRAFT_42953 [Jaapia argillacea MUCL 33604]
MNDPHLRTSKYFTPVLASRFFSSPTFSPLHSPASRPAKKRRRTLAALLSDVNSDASILTTGREHGYIDTTPYHCSGFETFADDFLEHYDDLSMAKPILIQEHIGRDPWKLVVAVMFLNKTSGKSSIPIFWELLKRWPTAEALSRAELSEVTDLLHPLGLQNTRASRLIALSTVYLRDPPHPDRLRNSKVQVLMYADHLREKLHRETLKKMKGTVQYPRTRRSGHRRERYPPTPISHLPGTGPYALDSYRIFCMDCDEWKRVMPADKELIKYLKWKWAVTDLKVWDPILGVVGDISIAQMATLITELSDLRGCHGVLPSC